MAFAQSLRCEADMLREKGLRVIPVKMSKAPALADGYQKWNNDKLVSETNKVLAAGNASGIGILTGESGAPFVFDVDLSKGSDEISGVDWYKRQTDIHGEWKTARVKTRNGTSHFYCLNEPRMHLLSCSNKIIKENGTKVAVDLKGPGGYVVAPSSFIPPDAGAPGDGKYTWVRPLEEMTYMPDWLYDMLPKKHSKKEESTMNVATGKIYDCFHAAIQYLPDKYSEGFDTWTRFIMCVGGYMKCADSDGEEKLYKIAHAFSKKCDEKYDEEVVTKMLNRVITYRDIYITIGTVIYWLNNDGGKEWKTMKKNVVTRNVPEGIIFPTIPVSDCEISLVKSWIDLLGYTQRPGGVSIAFAEVAVSQVASYVHSPNRYILFMETDVGTVYPRILTKTDIKNDHDDVHVVDGKNIGTIDLIRKYGKTYFGTRFSVYGEADPKYFNEFTGLQTQYREGVKREDVAILCDHLRHKIVTDEDPYNYITAWLGNLFLCRSRPKVALVIRGKQGNGKSFFWENIVLDKIFGVNFSHKFNNIGEALGQFNEAIKGKLFLMFDEIGYCPNRDLNDGLKQLISSKYMSVNLKGRQAFLCHMYHACVFLTNHIDGIHVAGYARRLACFDSNSDECSREYLKILLPIENDMEYIAKWMSYCIDFHHNHPEIDVNYAPMTSWKIAMGISSDSVLSMLIDRCQKDELMGIPATRIYRTSTEWKQIYTEKYAADKKISDIVFHNQMDMWCKKSRRNNARGYILGVAHLEEQVRIHHKAPTFTLSSHLYGDEENIEEYDENAEADRVAVPWQ